jgi:hypothetical protein
MVETMGVKNVETRSPWMVLPPYKISWKSTKWFKTYPHMIYTYIQQHSYDGFALQ